MAEKINIPQKGLNRAQYNLGEADYSTLLNGLFDGQDTGEGTLTNEMSNILSSKFREGFKVIKALNDPFSNNSYFFLVNPETGVGEFGQIKNTQQVINLEDAILECESCTEYRELAEPLEDLEQVEINTYETLLTDECKDSEDGFNFSIKHPIKKAVIKNEKCGKVIYFTDDYNGLRHIILNNLSQYQITGTDICEEDNTEVTCLDADKLLVFKKTDLPVITPSEIILGGQLKLGVYEFLLAYCDPMGNEISEYTSITNPIRLFDKNNTILTQEELRNPTNYSIKLNVFNLDKRYTNYKVVVIQNTLDSVGATNFYEEGVHTINDTTVVYGGEKNKKATSLSDILNKKLFVERVEFVSESNNSLVIGGITQEKEINLQPVVNLLGAYLKWQTHIAPETLYENAVSTSLFLGYNRDEIVPFSIRFILEGGYKTALFPFIGRTPTEEEMQELVDEEGNITDDNSDVASVLNSVGNCNTTNRTKRWQFYNDAEVEGFCGNEEIETVIVQEPTTKICFVEDIATSEDNSFTIALNEPFTTLEEYIEDNRDNPDAFGDSGLYDLLQPDNYEDETCLEGLFGENCDTIELVEDVIEVQEVIGETFEGVEKTFPTEYSRVRPPEGCNIYKINPTTGGYQLDAEFSFLYMFRETITFPTTLRVYYEAIARNYSFVNEDCSYADTLVNLTTNAQTNGYFHNYLGAETVAELQTTKTATCTPSAQWTNKIHKGGLWFKGEVDGRESFLLEVSKQSSLGNQDDVISSTFNPDQEVRLSIFNTCVSSSPMYCQIFSIKDGAQYKITITETGFDINDGTTTTSVVQSNLFPNGNFFVVIDNPIYESEGLEEYNEGDDGQSGTLITKYRTAPPDGCYSIVTRDVEFTSATISWETLILKKKSVYRATCEFEQPVVRECKAIPFQYGKFAYWQSEETYPDNDSLYNSSFLTIRPEDIEEIFRQEFEENYTDGLDEQGNYILINTDFTCQPIRHFKFPDNKVSPFMSYNTQSPFSESIIYPLGVTINEEVVNSFLDIAVNNGLISAEKRNKITAYEIFRGDITQDRSVVSSGLLYDLRSYQDTTTQLETFYSNYPYNDLGKDKLNLDVENEVGTSNSKWTFHSPETDYYKPTLPTELSVQGYMFGKSTGNFDQVQDHPKWVILTRQAKDLAGFLAGVETAAELAISLAQAAENYRGYIGFTNSVNPVGIGLSIAASALGLVDSVLSSYGRYRYEWLKTFRDLGQPENFASYYYSSGHYNYLKQIQEEENQLRGLTNVKYLKAGRTIFSDNITGERTPINNTDRENAVYLSSGTLEIEYPLEYQNYDNNEVDFNSSSLTFASENQACSEGRSEEIRRNIASPYVALKNYFPSQYSTLSSVKWLSTGFTGDLKNPRTDCLSIFGGDTFISRHTLKRKMPLFFDSAFGLADLTPFNYKFYSNIGKNPRFFVDYEVLTDFSRRSALFPDIDYTLRLDCSRRSGNYYRPPSKFYLYYYGVPSFLTETRINTNFRTAEDGLKKNFYPNIGDLNLFTQEKNVSIREPNYFFYNNIYSKSITAVQTRVLADTFNQEENDCRNNLPNGLMWSLPDNSENNLSDPWLIFPPLNFYEFPSSFGKLKDLRTIEREQILVRFDQTTALFDAIDSVIDDGQTPQTRNLATAFARRPLTYSETELGYGGTQNTESVSCEFGHFHVDAKRGQIIQVQPAGQGIQDISYTTGNKLSGVRSWFRENMPYKILKSNIEGIESLDIDNVYNGVGIAMGWDSRFKRVLITKKDYVPKPLDEGQSIVCIEGNLYLREDEQEDVEIQVTDSTYFEDVSFTIAYSPSEQRWIGWYSYTPNYYISHDNYFQTGKNTDDEEFGLWSHLLTNKSYQVFYGKKHPFVLEYMLKRDLKESALQTIKVHMDTIRYHNEFDEAYLKNVPVDKVWIFSQHNHSGELRLVPNTGQLSLVSKYPITASNGRYQEIISTETDGEWTINYFYNRVLKANTNTPKMFWDKNQIDKTLNYDLIKFGGKNILEPIRSNYVTVRLQFDQDTRLRRNIHLLYSKNA